MRLQAPGARHLLPNGSVSAPAALVAHERRFVVDRMCVLVCSRQESVADYVRGNVPTTDFEVVWSEPGFRTVRAAGEWMPDVVVIDCNPKSREATILVVQMIKKLCSNAKIIVRSEESTMEDVGLVEPGIFFYAAFPIGPDLIRVIDAAARGRRRDVT